MEYLQKIRHPALQSLIHDAFANRNVIQKLPEFTQQPRPLIWAWLCLTSRKSIFHGAGQTADRALHAVQPLSVIKYPTESGIPKYRQYPVLSHHRACCFTGANAAGCPAPAPSRGVANRSIPQNSCPTEQPVDPGIKPPDPVGTEKSQDHDGNYMCFPILGHSIRNPAPEPARIPFSP